jgi:hypothetical protein
LADPELLCLDKDLLELLVLLIPLLAVFGREDSTIMPGDIRFRRDHH